MKKKTTPDSPEHRGATTESERGTGVATPAWTPGPWLVERGNAGATHPLFVVSVNAPHATEATRYSLRPWCDADAHLIAAAPDLYAALETLAACILSAGHRKGYVVLTVDLERALPKARAALAKARGDAAVQSPAIPSGVTSGSQGGQS